MTDVFPRRNLPGDSDVWGREVESRTQSLDTQVTIVGQQVQSLNRNTASSLEVLAGQIQAVEEAQAEIELTQAQIIAAQADITAAQADITATTNFLSTQTVSSSKSTGDSYSGSNSGTNWQSFDSTYDCSLSVTTGPAGRLLIQASAILTGGGLDSIIGIEVVGQIGPSSPSPYSMYVVDGTAGATRVVTASLSANTTYTVRLRRGRGGSGSGVVLWGYQTLVVTRS